jgi:hypothetical protein
MGLPSWRCASLTVVLAVALARGAVGDKVGVWRRSQREGELSLVFEVHDAPKDGNLELSSEYQVSSSEHLVRFHESVKGLKSTEEPAFQEALAVLGAAVAAGGPQDERPAAAEIDVQAGRDLAGGGMSLLNSILGKLHVPISTADVGIIKTSISILTMEAKMSPTAHCSHLGISGASLKGTLVSNTEYDIGGRVGGLRASCTTGICVKTNIPFFTEWHCGGSITVHSAGSSLALTQVAHSADFSSQLPDRVTNKGGCGVSLQFISFKGSNIMKIIGYDITGLIIKELNGPFKATALAPLKSAACTMEDKIRHQINKLAVNNPLMAALDVDPPAQDPLALERQVQATSPGPLFDLQNNSLTGFLPIATDPETQAEAITLDTRSPMIASVLKALRVPVSDTVPLVPAVIQMLTGAPYASGQRVDVLSAVERIFPGVASLLSVTVPLDGLGSVSFNGTGLGLTMEGDFPFTYFIDLLGKQTLAMPAIELDSWTVDASVSMLLAVDASVQGNHIAFKLAQSFTVKLGVRRFVAKFAALLAARSDLLAKMELGPAMASPLDCLLSMFVQTPEVAEVVLQAAAITLEIDGFTDAIGVIGAQAVSALFPMYAGKLPDAVQYYAAKAIIGKQLIAPASCPEPALDKDPAALYDFSQGPIAKIGDLDTAQLVNVLLPKGEAVLVSGPHALVTVPLRGVPGMSDQNITLWLDELAVGLTKADSIELLHVSDGSLQLLHNLVQAEGLKVTIKSRLESTASGFLPDPTPAPTYAPSTDTPPPSPFPTAIYTTTDDYGSGAPTPSPSSAKPTPSPRPGRRRALSVATAPAPAASGDVLIGKSNKVTVSFGGAALKAGLDMLMTITNNDLVTTPIGAAMDVNCWMAKLQPYGGPRNVTAALDGASLNVACTECDSALLRALATSFSNVAGQAALFDTVAELRDQALKVLDYEFAPVRWNSTMQTFRAKCLAGPPPPTPPTPSSNPDIGELDIDHSVAIAVLIVLMVLLFVASVAMLVPAFRKRHLHQMEHAVGKPGDTDVVPTEQPASDAGAAAVQAAFEAPLWRNPSVPLAARLLVPPLFVLTLTGLLLGHLLQIVVVGATVTVLGGDGAAGGATLTLPDLDSFNVVSITQKMWANGAKLLALLVAVFSLAWPYVKLLMMVLCWFLPTSALPFRWRGLLLHGIERVGRWSLIEIFVVSFTLIAMSLNINSPAVSFLPKELYVVSIDVVPMFNLYTFTVALLLGLALSNIINSYHNRIGEARVLHRCEELGAAVAARAEERLPLLPTVFPGKHAWLGWSLLAGLIAAFSVLMAACSVESLRIEILGLLGKLLAAGGDATTETYSLFNLLGNAYRSGNVGEIFFTTCIILVAVVFPCFQLALMTALSLPFVKLSLAQAMKWREANTILGAWCALECYVLAVALSVLELGYLTTLLLQDKTAAITPVLVSFLYPAGVISKADAQAGALTLAPYLETSAWWFIAAVALTLVMQLVFKFALDKFISMRSPRLSSDEGLAEADEDDAKLVKEPPASPADDPIDNA